MGTVHVLPARTGVALELRRFETLRVIDPEGRQVCDLVAFRRRDLTEWISNGRTFDYNGTIYLTQGHTLYSNKSAPMLSITRDDVGQHDFLYTACSPEMYRIQYGAEDGHPNCLDNLTRALSHRGLQTHLVPTPFNIFQSSKVEPDGRLVTNPPLSRAGDAAELRAEMDLDVALSACSVSVCSGGSCTPIHYEIVR